MVQALLKQDLLIILAVAAIFTLVTLPVELEFAQTLYQPDDAFAWKVRHYSIYPGAFLSVAALIFLLIWPLRCRWPVVRQTAVVWLAALIFGSGLVGAVLAPETFKRPRPRDITELGGPATHVPPFIISAEKKGKSFTSGHAAIGFIFCAPFFALRRKYPKTAKGFLAFGLLFGGFLGYMRMVLGAHFISDVIWAAVLSLAFAAITAHFFTEKRDLSNRITVPLLLLALGSVVYFNKLHEELRFTTNATTPLYINLPCNKITLKNGDSLTVNAIIHTYGAPASFLRLKQENNALELERKWPSFYRNMSCTASITLPKKVNIHLHKKTEIILQGDTIQNTHVQDNYSVYRRK